LLLKTVVPRATRESAVVAALSFGVVVEGVLDIRRHVVPVALGAVVGGAQVIENVVEVDLGQVRRSSGWHRFAVEDIQRAQAKLEHRRRFVFVGRDLLDDVTI
jgi:hypothetical protein